jgi:hypothetical protein
MRAVVGIITRNIKIKGSGSWTMGGWGARVYVTDWVKLSADGSSV